MNIDKIYNEVIEKLQTEFGWSSLEQLSGMHEELVQDVIKAINLVKNNGVLDDVNVSFLCDFVNQFVDMEISEEAIKESLETLNKR